MPPASLSRSAIHSVLEASKPCTEGDLEALRGLLLSAERQHIEQLNFRLEQLESRITDPEQRARDTSEVLVRASMLRQSAGNEYSTCMRPVVEEQFHLSARENPDVLAEALFPILGPALRRMIANLIRPDKRSKGRPYTVEQLFLIDKESGLPICQVASEWADAQDADMVSGMLSAIQAYLQDAFSTSEFDSLNTLQLGELSVWIEWGPNAVLAAVVRGVPPSTCRAALQQRLELIHHDYATELENYAGDGSVFDTLKPQLLLFLDDYDGSIRNRFRALPAHVRGWAVKSAVLFACLLIGLIYSSYDDRRWQNYVNELEKQPGIVVTSHYRDFQTYHVFGLRDPLAVNPQSLLKKTSLSQQKVKQHFEPYQALHPQFVLQRLKATLIPPESIQLHLLGTTLTISGDAPKYWKLNAVRLARAIAGIETVVLEQSDSSLEQ